MYNSTWYISFRYYTLYLFSIAIEREKSLYDLREKQILLEKYVKQWPQEDAIVQ